MNWTKTVTLSELEPSVEEAALREAYFQQKAQRIIHRVPEIYSVIGNKIEMEYLQGTPLSQIRLTRQELLKIKNLVLDMIQALNKASIYHQDLHLDNILIDQHLNPWIVDFGAAYFEPIYGLNDTDLFLQEFRNKL